MQFLDAEVNGFHREDHYMAQIAAEIRRGLLKPGAGRRVKVQDFILKFTKAKEKKRKPPSMAESKAFWFAAVGLKKEQ